MKILFYVLWYFAIAFASMIALAKFQWMSKCMGEDGTFSVSESIFWGVLWPLGWVAWLITVFFYQLSVLLNKIKNT